MKKLLLALVFLGLILIWSITQAQGLRLAGGVVNLNGGIVPPFCNLLTCGGPPPPPPPPPPPDPCAANAQAVLNSSNVNKDIQTSCDAQWPRTATRKELETLASGTACGMWAISGHNCAGEHWVTTNSEIVAGLAQLASTGCSYAITAYGGGQHQGTSHYQGRSVDIDAASTGYGNCSNQQVKDAFCPRGLHVNNETSHFHVGFETFADICP